MAPGGLFPVDNKKRPSGDVVGDPDPTSCRSAMGNKSKSDFADHSGPREARAVVTQ